MGGWGNGGRGNGTVEHKNEPRRILGKKRKRKKKGVCVYEDTLYSKYLLLGKK